MKETQQSPPQMYGDGDAETDGNIKKTYYHGNNKKAGYIIYTVSICSYKICVLIQYIISSIIC